MTWHLCRTQQTADVSVPGAGRATETAQQDQPVPDLDNVTVKTSMKEIEMKNPGVSENSTLNARLAASKTAGSSEASDLATVFARLPPTCQPGGGPDRFNSLLLSKKVGNPLACMAAFVLMEPSTTLGLPKAELEAFVREVDRMMPANHYHDASHVTDVLQMMYLHTREDGPLFKLCGDPVVRLAALLGAVVHDLCHPGCNNAFLVKSEHPLITTYGTTATSEKMHVAMFKAMMSDPRYDFLGPLSAADRARVLDLVESVVMATDMSRHVEIIKSEPPSEPEQLLKHMLAFAIKTSDLSHCVRAFNVHNRFVDKLKEEFYSQGDQERILDYDVSQGMDRMEGYKAVAESQIFFLGKFIDPLFVVWSELSCHCPLIKELRSILHRNIGTWHMMASVPSGPLYADDGGGVRRKLQIMSPWDGETMPLVPKAASLVLQQQYGIAVQSAEHSGLSCLSLKRNTMPSLDYRLGDRASESNA